MTNIRPRVEAGVGERVYTSLELAHMLAHLKVLTPLRNYPDTLADYIRKHVKNNRMHVDLDKLRIPPPSPNSRKGQYFMQKSKLADILRDMEYDKDIHLKPITLERLEEAAKALNYAV